jgi:type I restriction enzyme S subunit
LKQTLKFDDEIIPPFQISPTWEWAPLERAVTQRRTWTTIQDAQTYRRVTVQLHGRGIIARDEILGAKIKTKKQQIIRSNDLLVAEIDAKMGAFGTVPPHLDGAVVSSHYFTFEIDETQLLPDFLALAIGTGHLTEQIRTLVRGSLNYAAIRPRHVLGIAFPFAPLPEQRKVIELGIVARRAAEAAEQSLQALQALPNAIFRKAMTNGTQSQNTPCRSDRG